MRYHHYFRELNIFYFSAFKQISIQRVLSQLAGALIWMERIKILELSRLEKSQANWNVGTVVKRELALVDVNFTNQLEAVTYILRISLVVKETGMIGRA